MDEDWFTQNSWPASESIKVKKKKDAESEAKADWFKENSWPQSRTLEDTKVTKESYQTAAKKRNNEDWFVRNIWPVTREDVESNYNLSPVPTGQMRDRRDLACCSIL